jgi:flagellar hook protein FlgE
MGGFYTAMSGLNADSTSLNTIGNNLSNMSTTGYKSSNTEFSTAFSQALGMNGNGEIIGVGTGVNVAANSMDFSAGAISSASSAADMAIHGSGFFVLNDNGTMLLTRSGDFQLSSTGILESTSGDAVEGYAATNGSAKTGTTLTDLTIPVDSTVPGTATSTFSFTQNLNAATPVGGSTTSSETIYDSDGVGYAANVTYTNLGANQWSYNIAVPENLTPSQSTNASGDLSYAYKFGASSSGVTNTVDTGTNLTISGTNSSGSAATITAPVVTSGETVDQYVSALNNALSAAGITSVTATNNNGVLSIAESSSSANLSVGGVVAQDLTNANGTLTFDSGGNLVSPSTSVTGIALSGMSDGAAAQNMTWNLTNSSGTPLITQTAGSSSTTADSQNGYRSGTFSGFAVGQNGTITATFSNGQIDTVGQLAIANVVNQQGLQAVGSTAYQATAASGAATIGTANANGNGAIQDAALEGSNVNISSEFADLIVAQRAFEANSKVVTTQDSMVQDTINIEK